MGHFKILLLVAVVLLRCGAGQDERLLAVVSRECWACTMDELLLLRLLLDVGDSKLFDSLPLVCWKLGCGTIAISVLLPLV